MAWLVVLDPIDGLAPKTDTSLALIDEARRQGIDVDTATIGDLFFERHAAVLATDNTNIKKEKRLGDYKLILMRKEPPYDLAFHYATHLLSLSGTLIANSATSLRNFNEKLIALPFKKYMPPTLVSSSAEIMYCLSPPQTNAGKPNSPPNSKIFESIASAISINFNDSSKEILSIRAKLNKIMATHTGQSIEKIEVDTDRDNFMSGNDSVEYGLIDKVLDSRKEVVSE